MSHVHPGDEGSGDPTATQTWADEPPGALGDPSPRRKPLYGFGHRAKGCLAVLVALGVVLAAVSFVLVRASGLLSRLDPPAADFSGSGSGRVVVQVEKGDTLAEVGRRLKEMGVVASVDAFIAASDGETVDPGYYQLRNEMSATSAIGFLVDGEHRVETTVTVPEGLTVDETLKAVAKQSKLSRRALDRAAERTGTLGLPRYARGELEGFLFPATYVLPPDTSARQVLRMMVRRFEQAAKKVGLEQAAADLGLNRRELVTVASLVQAEAQRDKDFGKVARVIYNRNDAGMPLQFDSTVHYATDTVGQVYTTEEQRSVDSPYNTYLVVGLPPGPINSPGEQALAAATDPTQGDWLYFVTVDLSTGETKFADDLTEHNSNVAELAEYCRSSDAC